MSNAYHRLYDSPPPEPDPSSLVNYRPTLQEGKNLTISYTTYCHFYTCDTWTNPYWCILFFARNVGHPWS